VGIFGSGVVAQALGDGFVKHGYEVMLGTRDASKLSAWQARNPTAGVGTFEETAQFGELIVLAVKGTVAAAALRAAGVENLEGKTVIDTCNPISDEPLIDGVLKYFTGPNESLMQQLQSEFPGARFVKAFNSVGSAFMVNPQFAGGPPTMFICGNDKGAKKVVRGILDRFGWEAADMGTVEAARAIEPLCILWCIPGFVSNDWGARAFKLLS
jgi:8-hydroxy-5-deazaflavin:NADPH oxidoreductase